MLSLFFIDTELGYNVPTAVLRTLNNGSSIPVPCPPAVEAYNQNMGRIDL